MIGRRIKELRKSAKLTQHELSEGIITRSYLSQIEKGMVQPSYEVLEQLAQRLNCTVDSFYEPVENKDLFLLQLKKDIKAAENNVLAGRFEKVKNIVQNSNLMNNPDLNDYDKGILLWIHGKYFEANREFTDAESCFLKSVPYLEKNQYKNELVRLLDSLGYVYLQMNKNEKALHILNQAYHTAIHEHVGGMIKISLLINLGIAHGKLKEYYSAINFLTEAQSLNQSMNAHYKAGQMHMALGVCYMELKRFLDAKMSYERALSVFRLADDKRNEAGIFTNLGILYAHQKDYEKSVSSLIKAIELYEQIGSDENKILNAKAELAKSYFLFDQLDEARKQCDQIINKKNSSYTTARAYEILGDIESRQTRYTTALEHYRMASDLYKQNKRPEYKDVIKKMAETYLDAGEYEQAAQSYRSFFK